MCADLVRARPKSFFLENFDVVRANEAFCLKRTFMDCVHEAVNEFTILSHRMLVQSWLKRQSPQKSVNLFFVIMIIKDKLKDWCGKLLFQNNFINTFCEIRSRSRTFPAGGLGSR